MAQPHAAAAALPGVAGPWRRAACIVATLIVLLALPAGAVRAPKKEAIFAPDGSFLGELIVMYRLGTTGLPDLTSSLQSAVAERLVQASEVLEPAAAAGGGSVAPAVADALRQPFTIIYATPTELERTSKGQPIPGAHAVVRVHPLLTGEQSAGVDVTARIVAALKESPSVLAVVKNFPDKPDVTQYCGSSSKGFCQPAEGNPFVDECCSATGTCGSDTDACTDNCNPTFGTCTSTVIPRADVLNQANLVSKMLSQLFIEATVLDAARTPLTTKDVTTGKGVPNRNLGYQLMILDSGVAQHENLLVTGCRNFSPDMNEANRGRGECDDFSPIHHGTHVAGIAGARNSAAGSWGVAPGARIFAGTGYSMTKHASSSAGTLAAFQWILANNDAQKIVVVNMSFGNENYSVNKTDDVLFIKQYCKVISDVIDTFGTVFVGSAGNSAKYVPANKLPVICDRVICATNLVLNSVKSCTLTPVTAADGSKYTTRSCAPNYVDATHGSNWAHPEDYNLQARTIAAPGTRIWSTIEEFSYGLMTGTSQAAPHVSGAAFRCFLAGECLFSSFLEGGGGNNYQRVVNAAAKRNKDPSYQWTPTVTTYDKIDGVKRYYGPLLWANKW